MTEREQIQQLALAGISRVGVEATLGRGLTDEELQAYRKAEALRKLRKAQAEREKARSAPQAMSAADRKAKMIASRNEIGDLPKVRHPRLVEACRYDLELFGWTFCRPLLDHRASEEIDRRLIKKLQQAILTGGQLAVEFTRGAGKTTWTIIAFIWAILYGHRRFPVCIAASKPLAKSIKNAVLSAIETFDAIHADFPAVAVPLRAIGGVVQRAGTITYHGRPVGFESSEMMFRLPMLRDDLGRPLSPACGAHFACRGVGASVRGLNEMGDRPDFLLFDDPQTQKDARSATAVERLDKYIHGDALNLGSNTTSMAAFITITPQRFGDLAHRIADKNLHPNWSTSVCPFLLEMCAGFEALADEFIEAYHLDAANDDFARTESRRWYRENRERFAGTVCVDPKAYDAATEYDAIHHALNKMAAIGKEAFNAEYQMRVDGQGEDLAITPELVSNALTGADPCVLPPGTDSAVAFCDVNIQKGSGLSWGVAAFGKGRIASIIAYGRYPENGALCPPGATDLAKKRAVAAAIREVTAKIASLDLRMAGTRRRVYVKALGFDRGYMPDVVCRTLFVMRRRLALPFQVCAVRGFGWQQFGSGRKDHVGRGDHVFVTRSEFGEYLAVHAPYWREIFQSGFLETPLMPGSVSLYGDDPARHWTFANEVCAERLVRRYVHPSGKLAWDWAVQGENHFCDVGTGLFALASWFRLYDALPHVLDTAAAKPQSADLFDPMLNPAIIGNGERGTGNGEEGTGETAPAPQAGFKTLEEWRREKAARMAPPRKHAIIKRRKARWVRK